MPNMSSDQIRDISVRVVEGFFNDKIPLSQGLAKEASANDLNLEQIKRATEVTNTITHLKMMELSKDRTAEFPLCKTAEVMVAIVTPQEIEQNEKVASLTESEQSYIPSEISTHEQTVQFIKEAAANALVLSQLEDRAITLQDELVKVASEVKKDKDWMRKLSSVDVGPHYQELSVLISGEASEPKDLAKFSLYKEAELKKVKALSELYKEAQRLVSELSIRRDLDKRAETLEQTLVKEAFIGKMIGKGLGQVVKQTSNVAKKVGVKAFSEAKSGVGIATGADALTYHSIGGAGKSINGNNKDVWDALQN